MFEVRTLQILNNPLTSNDCVLANAECFHSNLVFSEVMLQDNSVTRQNKTKTDQPIICSSV